MQLAGSLPAHQVSPLAAAGCGMRGGRVEGTFGMGGLGAQLADWQVPHVQAAGQLLCHVAPSCFAFRWPCPAPQTSTLRAVVEQLRWFAGPPIRNGAGLGGNICTASPISGARAGCFPAVVQALSAAAAMPAGCGCMPRPPPIVQLPPCSPSSSRRRIACHAAPHPATPPPAAPPPDLNPLWMAAGAQLTVAGQGSGTRTVAAADFFLGYRKVDLAPHEVLVKVRRGDLMPVECQRIAAVMVCVQPQPARHAPHTCSHRAGCRLAWPPSSPCFALPLPPGLCALDAAARVRERVQAGKGVPPALADRAACAPCMCGPCCAMTVLCLLRHAGGALSRKATDSALHASLVPTLHRRTGGMMISPS